MAMSQQEVIKRFMASLDTTTKSGTAALDEAINYATNGKFKTAQSLINQILADRENAKSGDDFLKRYCGIILGNADTGAITGSDAGGSTTKTSTSVVPNGTFDTSFSGNSFTKRGVTFQLNGKNFNSLTDEQKHIWQGLYSFWAEEDLKLIEESYGYSFNDSDVKPTTILIIFIEDSSKATATTFSPFEYGGKNYISMNINMYYFKNIDQDDPDGKLPNAFNYYLDRLIAHELTHAVMSVKTSAYTTLNDIIIEGMAELTTGTDDTSYYEIQSAVQSKDTLAKYLDDKNDKLFNEDYVGGYILLRYLARQFGDLSIANTTSNTVVSGFYGNDKVTNSASNVTISGGAGKDTIENKGAGNVLIKGENDADSIKSYGNNITIDGGTGNDYIYLYIDSSNVSVDAGNGNDEIYSGGQNIFIDGGADNDYIHLYLASDDVSVKAGKGNDTIRSYSTLGNIFQYANGDGNDTINGISANDTIKITGAQYEKVTTASSNDATLKIGSGSIVVKGGKNVAFKIDGTVKPVSKVINGTSKSETLFNVNDGYTINGGGGNDTIYSGGKNIIINTGTGNNIVELFKDPVSENVTVTGGSGNDTINSAGKNVNVNAGEGNNYILLYNQAQNNSIKTGSGKDNFEIYGSNNTLTAGKGNDSISMSSPAKNNIIVYNSGDGNDTITGIAANDSIKITGAEYEKVTTASSNDATLKIGSGSIVVKGGKNVSFKIDGKEKSSNIISLSSGNDTYSNSNSGKIIYALAGNDKVTNSASNVTIDGGDGADTINNSFSLWTTVNSSISGGAGKDSIVNQSGWYMTLSGGNGNDTIYNRAGSDYVYIDGGENNDSISNGGSNNTIFAGAGNDTIYNYNANGNNTRITISGGAGNDVINSGGYNISIDGGAGNDKISLLGSSYSPKTTTVKGGAGNDTIYNHSVGTIFQYANGDGKDTIYGFSENDTLQITSGTISKATLSGNDAVLTIGKGTITLKEVKGKTVKIKNASGTVSETIFGGSPNVTLPSGWKYGTSSKNSTDTKILTATVTSAANVDLTQNFGTNVLKVDGSKVTKSLTITGNSLNNTITGGKVADTIHGGAGNDILTGGNGNDIIYGDTGNDKLSGGSGADILYGGIDNDSLNGGAGNDFLIGGEGTNTLTGGKGNDIFDISAGKNYINDYKAGEDTLYLSSGYVASSSVKSSNLILNFSTGSNATIKGGKGKKITIMDSTGQSTTKIYSNTNASTLDLFEDNNFISDDTNLDSITEQKFSVTNIESINFTALEQNNKTFLTFAKK